MHLNRLHNVQNVVLLAELIELMKATTSIETRFTLLLKEFTTTISLEMKDPMTRPSHISKKGFQNSSRLIFAREKIDATIPRKMIDKNYDITVTTKRNIRKIFCVRRNSMTNKGSSAHIFTLTRGGNTTKTRLATRITTTRL